MWYLKQFEITNATDYTVLDQKIVVDKEDLLLFYRVEGTFLHQIDVMDLPYDAQAPWLDLTRFDSTASDN